MVLVVKKTDERRTRFLRIKDRRLEAAKKSLASVGKLSVRSNHDYKPEDVKEITKFLTRELYSVIRSFSASTEDRMRYYLEAELEHYSYIADQDEELYGLMKKTAPHLADFWNYLDDKKDTINKERLEEAFDQKKISADMLKAILAEKDLTKEDTAFMEKLVKRATSPGSIFTHDQGLHDRLDALGQGGTFSAAGTVISDKSIKDLVKALQENSNGGSGGGTNINAPQTNISSAPTTTIGAQVAPRQRVAVNG